MTDASDSILTSVKKVLGIVEDYTAFDPDIIMHINSAFSTLNQLGIGPLTGFEIEDASGKWDEFLVDMPSRMKLNNVKTYICLRLRLVFDPPQNSFTLTAFQDQIKELEWRMNVTREETAWVDPTDPAYDPFRDRI